MNTTIFDLESIITCPHCHAVEVLHIERGSSQHLFRCRSCNAILKPKSGDCCILCSFGNHDCLSSEQNLAA